ncbi:MAG: hypothetical protein E7598_03335 [Ruminococcaceae bacterium]|nr:hypothetical protein [Oscillospiraceae bacterium]
MRALLDTNIIIHRETMQATNYTIGKLYYWLDKLHYEKLLHPYTITELRKADNAQQQQLYDARLSAYTQMLCIANQTTEFISLLGDAPRTDNDKVDNQLLCEVYCGRADILITEDRRMRTKAERLGIADKVFSINAFISKVSADYPALVEYKALNVKKELMGNVDVNDPFFDTFRPAYKGFEKWFASKSDEEAYICRSDKNDIIGFLYLKTEDETENYSNITPVFMPKRRLKVGTFKVEASGFRLGERFVKIIFDNAIARNLDEIYVTLFKDRDELKRLYDLLVRWGFYEYGTKETNGQQETVLVKKLGTYDATKSVIANFPNLSKNSTKMILPIMPQYHTSLFPDSKLNTELEYIGNIPHRYALQKVYITWAFERNLKPGDLLLFYRMGDTYPKKYSSVITTVGVIDQVVDSFASEEDFLSYCQNRSVFKTDELKRFWAQHRYNLKVLKFAYVKSLTKRITLDYLQQHGIVELGQGPRPFTRITDAQFAMILHDSETTLYM